MNSQNADDRVLMPRKTMLPSLLSTQAYQIEKSFISLNLHLNRLDHLL